MIVAVRWGLILIAVVLLALPIFVSSTLSFLLAAGVGLLGWRIVSALIQRFAAGGSR